MEDSLLSKTFLKNAGVEEAVFLETASSAAGW